VRGERLRCVSRVCHTVLLVVFVSLTPHPAEAAHLEYHEGFPIIFLDGSPYELGRQHGRLLKDSVRQAVAQILGYFRRYPKVPLLGPLAVNWWLDRPWEHARPFLPPDYVEELRGLSEASGVSLRDLWRLHAIPDRTYSCSNLVAWGRATADGRLIHTRNLDWTIQVSIQDYATMFVVRPDNKQAFVNVGWAGFIGVLSGVNAQRLSIGQIGAETVDVSYRGLPMAFLMRKVLEESSDTEDAAQIIREAPRTVGVNYVVADAKQPRGIVVETTHRHATVFEADDPKEHAVSYARPIADAVFRADTAIDPIIRDLQLASKGNPRRRGLEPPGGSAYEIRYLGQAAGITANYGRLDAQRAIDVAKAVAPDSNVQSVVFAWPEVWVANAQGATPASHTTYHRLDVERFLRDDRAPRPEAERSFGD